MTERGANIYDIPRGGDRIAVLIPCYNEALTVGKVIEDFARELPGANIYVYDNNSSDNTAGIAAAHGATVRFEPRQGKGYVVRQMFRDIDADYYILVDGDDTYPAEAAHALLEPLITNRADMVAGDRLSNKSYARENKRAFHIFGNNLVRALVAAIYGVHVTDVLTGYRAFNRVFVKTFPILSGGFEIETELTIHAIDKTWRIQELPIDYRDRPTGSTSKLSTIKDGLKVLATIMTLFKDYKPLVLFALVSAILVIAGLVLGLGVVFEYFQTGLVERFPTAVLSVALIFIGLLALACGLILDTTVKGYRKEYELDVMRVYGYGQERAHHNSAPHDH
jgi:glycosyltransferase involved in cell wall biosynthesis